MNGINRDYALARRVLLQSLEALKEHLASLVLVGAQAVYTWTDEDNSINLPLMTTDADIAIDADILGSEPILEEALKKAGFIQEEGANPGHWQTAQGVVLDLIINQHQAGVGRRSAKIPPHSKTVARRSSGLAPALIDKEERTISSFETGDSRSFTVAVAGPAALTVAKCHKIQERLQQGSHRVKSKDVLDLYRLLRNVELDTLVRGFKLHTTEPMAKDESEAALVFLEKQIHNPASPLRVLLSEALGEPDTEHAEDFAYLTTDLLTALERHAP